jgi:hypothetical protein
MIIFLAPILNTISLLVMHKKKKILSFCKKRFFDCANIGVGTIFLRSRKVAQG